MYGVFRDWTMYIIDVVTTVTTEGVLAVRPKKDKSTYIVSGKI